LTRHIVAVCCAARVKKRKLVEACSCFEE
jgi:hypothetical protein